MKAENLIPLFRDMDIEDLRMLNVVSDLVLNFLAVETSIKYIPCEKTSRQFVLFYTRKLMKNYRFIRNEQSFPSFDL